MSTLPEPARSSVRPQSSKVADIGSSSRPHLHLRVVQAGAAVGPYSSNKYKPRRANSERTLQHALLVFNDLALVWFSAFVALLLRFNGWTLNHVRPSESVDPKWAVDHLGFLLLYSVFLVLFCNTHNLYSGIQRHSAGSETLAIGKSVGLATVLMTLCIFLSGMKSISRLVISATVILSLIALISWRQLRRFRLQTNQPDGWNCRNVLIVGTDPLARQLHNDLERNRYLGYVVKGFLVPEEADSKERERPDTLGTVEDLRVVARAHFIDEIFICHSEREVVKRVISEAQRCKLGVRVIPDMYDGLAWGAPIEHLGEFPTMLVHQRNVPALALLIKRCFDVILSAAALILISPLLAIIALAVKLESSGPVIYVSERVGRKGQPFRCYKFRTMVANAEELRERLRALNERDGILFKIANDPRITRIGRALRKFSLDELPQLWNVLKGDMSVVGPRPPLASEVSQYELQHLRRLDVLPGITGLWQVEARSSPSFQSYITLDMRYVEHWSLFLDLKIVLKTLKVVIAGTGS